MSETRIPYNRKLKTFASANRSNPTWSEARLWKHIRRKQLGVDFNRQKPLLNYIVDFYCIELKLAIEIDGNSHDERKGAYDAKRQEELEEFGIVFLRFTEYEVYSNLEGVLETILQCMGRLKYRNTP